MWNDVGNPPVSNGDVIVNDVIFVQVIVKMEESFGGMKVEHFLQLYKAFLIWPTFVSPSLLLHVVAMCSHDVMTCMHWTHC